MGLVNWADKRIKRLGLSDLQLIKLSVLGFSLMIAKILPVLLSLAWYWYALLFVLAAIKPFYKVLARQG